MTTTIPSVSEITPILTELGVFPDILPYNYQHQLKGTLEIKYPTVSVTAGQTPHRDEVQTEPTIRFHPVSALDSQSTYTLLMADPDLMKTNDPINQHVRHWVLPGLAPSETGDLRPTRPVHTSFLPSAPMPATGPHRYVFILAREPSAGTAPTVGERDGLADFKERLGWSAGDFVRDHNLEVVGVACMKIAPTARSGIDDIKLMAESAKHLVTG